MKAPLKLTLYTKADCSLCEKMEAVIDSLSKQMLLSLSKIDIAGDEKLLLEYGEDIPVLFCGGTRLGRHRLDKSVLQKKLENLLAVNRSAKI